MNFDVPLLPGAHVTADTGTGFVHTAPGHGEDDFELMTSTFHDYAAKSRCLQPGRRGWHLLRRMCRSSPASASSRRDGKDGDANGAVIKALIERGKLLAKGTLRHSYPHQLALQGAGDLPRHAAMVRRHRQADSRLERQDVARTAR